MKLNGTRSFRKFGLANTNVEGSDIITMGGSCIEQIFPFRKLDALAHTIHANIHTHIHIVHTHTHNDHLHLWKCLLKKESFELCFEVREGGEIPQAGRQRIPDSLSNKTERTVTNRSEIAFRNIQTFLAR